MPCMHISISKTCSKGSNDRRSANDGRKFLRALRKRSPAEAGLNQEECGLTGRRVINNSGYLRLPRYLGMLASPTCVRHTFLLRFTYVKGDDERKNFKNQVHFKFNTISFNTLPIYNCSSLAGSKVPFTNDQACIIKYSTRGTFTTHLIR